MVIIRLKRLGSNHKPYYRIIVSDSRNRGAGAYLDLLGTYDPKPKDDAIKVDQEKLEAWIKKGAQMTPKVKSLVKRLKGAAAR